MLVIEENAQELRGEVDTVTEDGTILWLHRDSGGGRKLIMRIDNGGMWRMTGDC